MSTKFLTYRWYICWMHSSCTHSPLFDIKKIFPDEKGKKQLNKPKISPCPILQRRKKQWGVSNTAVSLARQCSQPWIPIHQIHSRDCHQCGTLRLAFSHHLLEEPHSTLQSLWKQSAIQSWESPQAPILFYKHYFIQLERICCISLRQNQQPYSVAGENRPREVNDLQQSDTA